tara:strand:- start:1871 stop:2407 length:537 start_codon:yes stop_codon:yes gene_type:complete
MVDEYNNSLLNNNKKRKVSKDIQNNEALDESNNESCVKSGSLREQVAVLSLVQKNLIELLRNKLDVTDEEISKCVDVGEIKLAPIKRNPRETPGIYIDENKRKYYINVHGGYVYKRPCGKPKKEKKWCYALGEWVEPNDEVSEEVANTMVPDAEDPEDKVVSDEEEEEPREMEGFLGA